MWFNEVVNSKGAISASMYYTYNVCSAILFCSSSRLRMHVGGDCFALMLMVNKCTLTGAGSLPHFGHIFDDCILSAGRRIIHAHSGTNLINLIESFYAMSGSGNVNDCRSI